MDWKKQMENGLKSGISSSKKFFEKAKDKAKDIGDYSVLVLEVKQLQTKHDELVSQLGALCYHLLMIEGKGSISSRSPELKDLLVDLESTSALLASKREKLKKESGAKESETKEE